MPVYVFHPNASMYFGPPEDPPISRAGYILLAVIMAVFTGLAIVLNGTVIIVSVMNKQLRQPLNYALVNLAVADLGTALTGGVLTVITNAHGYFSLGHTGCVLEGFAVAFCGITSLCTVALIAVERMFVICKPLGHISFDKTHALVGIGLSWLWSLAWNLPPLFGWGRYELEGIGTSCAPDWHNRDPSNVSFVMSYFAVCFAVPFALIVLSYGKLLWTLHKVSKLGVEGGAVAKGETRVAFMVVLMVLTFLVSWLPYASLAMVTVFFHDVPISPLVGTVPVYLAKSSTAYNPIIYIYLNKQFRKYAVPFLLCRPKQFVEDERSEATTMVESGGSKVSPS
uniref:G-protein coupled receptors family 1 profile domain-containing protein n=1 Tax=Periophthalmus magnuspinnatus TaxID=409849 RepID=A0A3B3ZF49_9GOBI